jgi:hypothetical protein
MGFAAAMLAPASSASAIANSPIDVERREPMFRVVATG